MSSGALTLSDLTLVVFFLPVVEVVVFILLCYSGYAAGDFKKCSQDESVKATSNASVQNNLMWVRIFAALYCVGFFLKWATFFEVFPGRIMPLKGKKSLSNEFAIAVFVVGDWFRYSMLPAGALCVILHLLNAYKQLHGSELNKYLKNTIIGLFVGAMIFRFVFQYQTATNVKVIDVCFRPMTCNPMWFISTCLSGWILWKAKKAASLLENGTLSPDHQARQTLLFRKLWAMFIGCTVAVIGRTIQLMGCESPHTIESNFSYRMVKRIATFAVLITQLIVSWHSLQAPRPSKMTEESHGGSRLIRVTSGSTDNNGHHHHSSTLQLSSYINKNNEEISATGSMGSNHSNNSNQGDDHGDGDVSPR